jgi:glycine/D-amino acid oxidase-like deaminating enzyme
VVDHRGGRHQGTLALLCIGDRRSGLGGRVGAALEAAPFRRCRLQMMQTAPTKESLTTAIAGGDSLRYYPPFDLPGRAALPPPDDETATWSRQLLLVQRAGGGLTIGDTHIYDEPFDFAVDRAPYHHLAEQAEAIFGWTLPPVVRRWAGVYSLATDGSVYLSQRVDEGIVVITGAAGRGMTLSPVFAEETWDGIVA